MDNTRFMVQTQAPGGASGGLFVLLAVAAVMLAIYLLCRALDASAARRRAEQLAELERLLALERKYRDAPPPGPAEPPAPKPGQNLRGRPPWPRLYGPDAG